MSQVTVSSTWNGKCTLNTAYQVVREETDIRDGDGGRNDCVTAPRCLRIKAQTSICREAFTTA